jgi:hypothetical protein
MSYTPLTDAFYLAMSGDTAAQGAGGRPITSAIQTTYAREINAAFAFAQEFDTQWGDAPPDLYQAFAIAQCSESYWRNRDDGSDVPDHYAASVAEIIALILEGSAVLTAAGITPPAFNTGGGEPTLASGWGSGGDPYDTAGEVLATVTLTPTSTGLLHCEVSVNNLPNAGDAEVGGFLFISIGADNTDPTGSPLEMGFDAPSGQATFPSFSVDLDRGSPPFTAPVGESIVVNICGKTSTGTLGGFYTLSVQERSE